MIKRFYFIGLIAALLYILAAVYTNPIVFPFFGPALQALSRGVANSWLMFIFYEDTLKVGLLMVVIMAVIESLVVRKYTKTKYWLVLLSLFVINLIISTVGLFIVPPSANIWISFGVAFIEVIILEGILMFFMRTLGKARIRVYFKVSTLMHLASYAVMAIAVVGILYLPLIGTEDKAMLGKLNGKILLDDLTSVEWGNRYANSSEKHSIAYVDLKSRPVSMTSPHVFRFPGSQIKINADGSTSSLLSKTVISRSRGIGKKFTQVQLPKYLTNRMICDGGRYIWCYDHLVRPALFDVKSKHLIYKSPQRIKIYPDIISYDGRYVVIVSVKDYNHYLLDTTNGKAINLDKRLHSICKRSRFSHNGYKLAIWSYNNSGRIIIYDCAKDSKVSFKVPGWIEDAAWSPDGKYIAYTTNGVNPYTRYNIHFDSLDLRVVSVDGKHSATIMHNIPLRANSDFVWMR